MSNKNQNKGGSIYYSKKDNRYRCTYYVLDKDTLKETRKTKSFLSEQEAKDFLTSIQYQKGNDLFIKNNGIPLNQLMRENVERKLELNLIGERTYGRTLKQLANRKAHFKEIFPIYSSDIQIISYFKIIAST